MLWNPPETIYSVDDKFRITFQQSSGHYQLERFYCIGDDEENFWSILGDFRSLNEAKEAADDYVGREVIPDAGRM